MSSVMLIIFVMVQMRHCSDTKKLHGSVDLFSLFQTLVIEEMEPVITAIGKYKITNAKFKSSKKGLQS